MTLMEMMNLLLDKFPAVFVAVNADSQFAKLPAHLNGTQLLRLAPSEPGNVKDLDVTEAGITALLSFEGSPFSVDLPWACVIAMGVPPFTVNVNHAFNHPKPKPKLGLVKS